LGTTLLLAGLGQNTWQVLPVVWALVPLVNLVVFLRVPMPQTVPEEHRTTLRQLLSMSAFRVALMLMLCATATELTLSQWSSLFAEQGLSLTKVWGDIAGPCCFAVLMGIGRVIYGLHGEKIPLLRAMIGCGALATLCYLVAALSHHAVWSLVGCAVCGLAVSLMWPGTFSLAAARFPLGGAAMFGLLALFGDAGAGLGPWLAGAVADATAHSPQGDESLSRLLPAGTSGLRAGVLVGTLFPLGVVAAAIAYGFTARRQDSTKAPEV
jgi:fucose permease